MIKKLENQLNEITYNFDHLFDFELNKTGENSVQVKLVTSDTKEEIIATYEEVQIGDTELLTLDNIIKAMYQQLVNPKSSFIKKWNGFSKRKVKQLTNALEKNDTVKVAKIQLELVDMYKKVSIASNEIGEIKEYIKVLYQVKKEYEVEGFWLHEL